jgi:flavin-dependent dehydrogenase
MIARVALFGDAAGLCKPTTGGGIGPGFAQVDLVTPLLLDALEGDNLSDSSMRGIAKLMEPMRKDQRRARALRDAFLTESSDAELDEIFSVWARPEVTELINDIGEIEHPIPLGIKMLRDIPEFRSLTKRAVKAILLG